MMENRLYSDAAKAVIQSAFRRAWERGQEHVTSGHLLYALAGTGSGAAHQVLRRAGLEQSLVEELLQTYEPAGSTSRRGNYLYLASDAARVLELAEAQADKLRHQAVEPEHLLLGLLQETGSIAGRMLSTAGANPEEMAASLLEQLGKQWPNSGNAGSEQSAATPGETKTLDQYSRDLTQAAREGTLDPVIGRENEVQRMVQILSRRQKNNPVLVGEPGVGKTAVAEGLAQRIVSGDVPDNLLHRRILALDLTRMVAGTKYRGEFEERLKAVVDEATANREVILLIDEVHTLVGAGAGEGSMDAANILKPALGRGEMQVIGATTLDEYRKHIEKDAALERRFQPVMIDEPDKEDSLAILRGLRERYEEHHGLQITDEALEAAVNLSSRYIQDRYLPDKAIDLIDEAAARVRTQHGGKSSQVRDLERKIEALENEKQTAIQMQDFEQAALMRDRQSILRQEMQAAPGAVGSLGPVAAEDVAQVVSSWTGVPVTMLTQDESQRLLKLEDTLHQRVVGQEEAVRAVAKAIRRGRTGLADPRRPMGSFLFLGPTGVGKTELCKALAEAMFQDEDAMLRIDMSEYMEPHSVSKLIGSPPGYVGYDEGGQLTEQVRRKPYSVILFDEIEKAHGDVWNALLQILEDGRLTDAQGRRVSFKNAIIVMTSNVGARNITEKRLALGFSAAGERDGLQSVESIREKVTEELKRTFRPEFINRIDEVIVFHQLEREHIRSIAYKMLEDLAGRLRALGVELETTEAAVELLVDKGFDPVYGARPLRRVIQTAVEDPAAEKLLELGPQGSGTIRLDVADGGLTVELAPAPQAAEAAPQEREPVAAV